jgi:hypothetical protein
MYLMYLAVTKFPALLRHQNSRFLDSSCKSYEVGASMSGITYDREAYWNFDT